MRTTRKQHEAGIARLNKMFNWTPAHATSPRGAGKRGKARRVAKLARAARRRNR